MSPLSQDATGLPIQVVHSAKVKAQEIAEFSGFLTVRKNERAVAYLIVQPLGIRGTEKRVVASC
jgi:hypothetical protein